MTKEELEKESENWIVKYTGVDVETQRAIKLQYYGNLKNAYIASAEPREKRIADLEAQIEKMKNCRNCKKFMIEGVCGHFLQVGWCKNWELVD